MGLHDPFGHLKHKLWPKKGRESCCHFNSRPLKVGNCLDFLACMWHATYRWKTLNEGYNFVVDLISIGGLHTKLWASKVVGFPISGISRLQLGSPGTKWHLGADPWLGTNNTKSLGHGESCEFVFAHGSFVHQKCFNYALTNLLFGLCKFVWVIDCLSHFLVPIPELQHAPLHQSVAN
jgi:hypothetical protein